MKNQIIQTTKTIILALILTLGISYVMAWTGPTSTPPDGNTPTPINIGTTDQVKNGGLGINALSVFGTGYLGKIKVNTTGDTGSWELYTNGDTYTSGTLRADTDMRSAKYCDINGANCKTTSQMGGGGTAVWGSCYYTKASYSGKCNSGYFLVEMDRAWCGSGSLSVNPSDPSQQCWAKCCRILIQ